MRVFFVAQIMGNPRFVVEQGVATRWEWFAPTRSTWNDVNFLKGFSRAQSWRHGNLCPKVYQHMLPTNTHIWACSDFLTWQCIKLRFLSGTLYRPVPVFLVSCLAFLFLFTGHHLKRTSHPNFSSTFPQQGTDPPNLSAKCWYFLEIWTVPKASQKPYILPENWQFKPWKWMVGRRFFSVWDTAYFQRQAVGFRECIFVQCPITLAKWKTYLYWDAIVIAIITTKMHR